MKKQLLAAFVVSGVAVSSHSLAAVILPILGTSATEAVVGGSGGQFKITSGSGTPGTTIVNYNPAGYFGATSAAVSGVVNGLSSDGKNSTSAAGSSAVDLASGQMHLIANTTRLGSGVNGTSVSSIASSGVLAEVITITGAISAPTVVRISMTVDGSFTSTGIGGGAPTDLRSALGAFALAVVGGGNAYAELFLNNLSGGFVQEQDLSSYGGHVIRDSGNASGLQFTLYDDVVVTDTSRTIPIQAVGSLNLISPDSPGTITADFGNTARLSVTLPTGLGFTSRSTVFLTSPQDNVSPPSAGGGSTTMPEPSSSLLLMAGLIGGAVVRLRVTPRRCTQTA